MISVNDRVCEGFAQCDLDVALALRNTAALPEQEHELIHEGRNRSHLAWQRALQFDAGAAVIVRYRHRKPSRRSERQPFRCPDPSSRGHRRQLAANRSFTFSGNLCRGGTPALRTRCSPFWPKNHGDIVRFDAGLSLEEQLYEELDARAELSAVACRAHNCSPKCWWQSCTDDGRRNSRGSLRKFVAEHGQAAF